MPYKLSDYHAHEPFQLVYVDIWGAYRVPGHGKFRYFLTIVDDHSFSTWIREGHLPYFWDILIDKKDIN